MGTRGKRGTGRCHVVDDRHPAACDLVSPHRGKRPGYISITLIHVRGPCLRRRASSPRETSRKMLNFERLRQRRRERLGLIVAAHPLATTRERNGHDHVHIQRAEPLAFSHQFGHRPRERRQAPVLQSMHKVTRHALIHEAGADTVHGFIVPVRTRVPAFDGAPASRTARIARRNELRLAAAAKELSPGSADPASRWKDSVQCCVSDSPDDRSSHHLASKASSILLSA
jgi:hypothetical protein